VEIFNKKILFTVLLILITVGIAFAQSTPPTPAAPPPGFPIDGGLLLLGAVALGYGITKKKK